MIANCIIIKNIFIIKKVLLLFALGTLNARVIGMSHETDAI